MRLAGLLILLLSSTLALADPGRAGAETRVALVIGNAAYRDLDELRTTRDDALAVAAALGQLDFAVDVEIDLDRRAMERAVRDFGRRAEAADIALMFYAGHGAQVAGDNYLLPVDASFRRERDLLYEALPLDLVLDEVAKAQRLNVVILDAGRASPFTEQLRDALGPSRAPLVGDGLARIAELPADTMVVLAAGPHQVALDGAGEHSPFTAALLRHLDEPGADLELILRKVRDKVRMTTGNRQQPTYYAAPGAGPSSYVLSRRLAPVAAPDLEHRLPVEAVPAAPEEPAATGDYETRRASNIRRGPGADTELIATVPAGTPLKVLGRAEGRDWYQVETAEGARGFIQGQLIRSRGVTESPATAALPAAEAPPMPREEPPPAQADVGSPVPTSLARSDGGKLVQVFYGTDRVNAGTGDAPRFSGERARRLSLGTVVVRIPPAHQIGQVERPWSFSVLGRTLIELPEDPAEHFTVLRIALSDEATFVDELSQVVDASAAYEDQAFVFVHGYNVGFEAAAFRTAQIAHDLQFDGAPIFYSWPSRGDLTDYEYDQNSASQARPFLKEFLELVRRRSGAEVVHLIAHSMGSGPLMEVLAELNAEEDDDAGPLFNEIVLAAPDIDVDVFYYLAKRIQGVAGGITLYASSEDRAMQASRQYARGVPRAGDVPEDGPVIEPGIDTIDASAIGTGFFGLNHSVYAENRILLNDIGLLLRAGLRPPDARNLTLVRVPGSDGYYWKYPH